MPPDLSPQDTALLRRAVALAERGLYTTTPNPRVGCVICRDGEVVAEGWHERAGEAHAEIRALAMCAGNTAGAEVYLSLEPCAHEGATPPCAAALVAAGVRRVVIAVADPNPLVDGKGVAALRGGGIDVAVADPDSDVARAARRLNIGFFSRIQRRRPWVRLKIAASLDGKSALASGLSRWISGKQARADGHHYRARSCVVMTGIGTALQDNPMLNVRHVPTSRQPLRVLVDSKARAPREMKIFRDDNVLWANAVEAADAAETAGAAASSIPRLACPDAQGKIDLAALLRRLSAEYAVNEVLVEAGRKLNGALLTAGLADEIILYSAPVVFGERGKDLFTLPPLEATEDAPRFHCHSSEMLDNGDVKTIYLRQDAFCL